MNPLFMAIARLTYRKRLHGIDVSLRSIATHLPCVVPRPALGAGTSLSVLNLDFTAIADGPESFETDLYFVRDERHVGKSKAEGIRESASVRGG
jgi:hypothetical protein